MWRRLGAPRAANIGRLEPARLIAALVVADAARDQLARIRAEREAEINARWAAEDAARAQERAEARAATARRLGVVTAPARPRGSNLFRSCWRAFFVIGVVSAAATAIGTVWASTSLQTSPIEIPYQDGLAFLAAITITTALPALLASWIFDGWSWRASRLDRSFVQMPGWHRLVLLLAGVVPPALFFYMVYEGSGSFEGGAHGPPLWWWLIGPVALAGAHVCCLLVRAVPWRVPVLAALLAPIALGVALAAAVLEPSWEEADAIRLSPFADDSPGGEPAPDSTGATDRFPPDWRTIGTPAQMGSLAYQDGSYVGRVADGSWEWAISPTGGASNVRVGTSLVLAGGAQGGVICRRSRSRGERFYFFFVAQNGTVGISKWKGGRAIALVQRRRTPQVARQRRHTLQARCVGRTLSLLVDGKRIARAQDGELRSGSVGVIVGSGVVRFESFSATALDAP